MTSKKLIEVALPLERINAHASYEKMPGIGAHPRGIHLWWARRPFTVARAVIWSSIIDDPSSRPDLFPTEEDQNKERERLFGILESLSNWKNSQNPEVIKAAKKELLRATNNNMPELLDPFSGGGAIPLEALRLGINAYAHDLNPVAVLINKVMIEIPSRFMNKPPINAEELLVDNTTFGIYGIAEDFRYYSKLLLKQAEKKVGNLYPDIKLTASPEKEKLRVIAWLWSRTIRCPNPACKCETPLFKSAYLSKKKGRVAWVEPIFRNKDVSFLVHHDGMPQLDGTVSRKGAICASCGNPIDFPYIREEGRKGKMRERLMAIVANGKGGKVYLSPDPEQEQLARISKPKDYPDAPLPNNPRNFNTPIYGLDSFSKLLDRKSVV